MTFETIKNNLIKSCINLDPWMFLPFLCDEKVKTDFPSKLQFFNSFTSKIECAKRITNGKLSLKITKPKADYYGNSNTLEYNFFDEVHLNERLSIFVIEENKTLFIDMHPF